MPAFFKTVGKLDADTPSDRELRFRRQFDAPAQLVFDAHTKPDLLKRWMLGPDGWIMAVCEVDLRVGGGYRIVWRHEVKGDEMGLSGTYREIEAPRRLVNTELFDVDWTGGETLCTLLLDDVEGRTDMTLLILYPSEAARDGALQTGMMDGMEAGYVRLDQLVVA